MASRPPNRGDTGRKDGGEDADETVDDLGKAAPEEGLEAAARSRGAGGRSGPAMVRPGPRQSPKPHLSA